jgi:citrate lyase subunit beta/citryl-CoA lyase
MPASAASASLLLFVPADRPDRFAKAVAAGADAVIIDLEDAVAPGSKDGARAGLVAALEQLPLSPSLNTAILVRINASSTPWHAADLAAVASLPVAGVVVPKAESAAELQAIRGRLGDKALIALVETARGIAAAEEIAAAADRVAFGSVDFAADLGCAHTRDALLFARSRLIMAARLAGAQQPIDGVTLSINDERSIEDDTRYGVELGFGGKLLIHPGQVPPARRGLAPTDQDIAWAERIVAGSTDGAARAVDGIMVDAPVVARAIKILQRRDQQSNG